MIFLSSIALDRTEVTAAVNRIIIPAAALAIAALLLIGLWFYTGISGKWNFSILLLLLAALVQTFYYLRNLGYYLPNNQLFDIPILGLGRPLFVYMPMIYLWLQMDKYRKIYAPLLLIPAFFTTLFEYLGVLGVNVWDLVYFSWQLLIPELILLIIFLSLKSVMKTVFSKYSYRHCQLPPYASAVYILARLYLVTASIHLTLIQCSLNYLLYQCLMS